MDVGVASNLDVIVRVKWRNSGALNAFITLISNCDLRSIAYRKNLSLSKEFTCFLH